eukprot:PhM_4_TR248/c1_g1_i1/m.91902
MINTTTSSSLSSAASTTSPYMALPYAKALLQGLLSEAHTRRMKKEKEKAEEEENTKQHQQRFREIYKHVNNVLIESAVRLPTIDAEGEETCVNNNNNNKTTPSSYVVPRLIVERLLVELIFPLEIHSNNNNKNKNKNKKEEDCNNYYHQIGSSKDMMWTIQRVVVFTGIMVGAPLLSFMLIMHFVVPMFIFIFTVG